MCSSSYECTIAFRTILSLHDPHIRVWDNDFPLRRRNESFSILVVVMRVRVCVCVLQILFPDRINVISRDKTNLCAIFANYRSPCNEDLYSGRAVCARTVLRASDMKNETNTKSTTHRSNARTYEYNETNGTFMHFVFPVFAFNFISFNIYIRMNMNDDFINGIHNTRGRRMQTRQ